MTASRWDKYNHQDQGFGMVNRTNRFVFSPLNCWLIRVLRILVVLLLGWASVFQVVDGQELMTGDAAVIVADGDGLLLRDGPGYDATPLTLYPDGTTVTITDGPIYAADGSVWFAVIVSDQPGYMVADYLVAASGSESATEPSTDAATGVYLAGPACGPDETWLVDSARRLSAASTVWLQLGDELAAGAWGGGLELYQNGFVALRDAQAATSPPSAGQRLQDALVALFDGFAAAVWQIRVPALGATSVGMDFDEFGAYERLSSVDLVPLGEEAQSALTEVVGLCYQAE
jgi:hypothetical protein